MLVCTNAVGYEALLNRWYCTAEPEASSAVPHIENDTPLPGLPDIVRDFAIIFQEGELACIEVGVDIEPHDVVIACHSLGMFDIQEALAKMNSASKKYIYILSHAGRWMNGEDDKFQWAILGGRPMHRHSDYIMLYNILHDMKIFANVDIQDTEFEQQYESLDDAVDRWKEMRDIPPEKEDVLKEHLSSILEKDDETGRLYFRRKSKSATIWWQNDQSF